MARSGSGDSGSGSAGGRRRRPAARAAARARSAAPPRRPPPRSRAPDTRSTRRPGWSRARARRSIGVEPEEHAALDALLEQRHRIVHRRDRIDRHRRLIGVAAGRDRDVGGEPEGAVVLAAARPGQRHRERRARERHPRDGPPHRRSSARRLRSASRFSASSGVSAFTSIKPQLLDHRVGRQRVDEERELPRIARGVGGGARHHPVLALERGQDLARPPHDCRPAVPRAGPRGCRTTGRCRPARADAGRPRCRPSPAPRRCSSERAGAARAAASARGSGWRTSSCSRPGRAGAR